MKQDKRPLINALLSHYQEKVVFLSEKKTRLLKNLLKKSNEFKVEKLKKEIEKSII
ncbi:MAG: hypothetical protein WC797_01245 [Candidatus Paceibacterota bacterium]